MKKKKVLIKTYKGIKIYFQLEDSRLIAKDKETGEEFNGKYVFEIERQIDEPVWEAHKANGFMIGGTFSDEIYKVKSVKRDRKTKKHLWVKGESTGSGFDSGKKIDYFDRNKKIYQDTEHNRRIFERVTKQQSEVDHHERVLKDMVRNLK